MLNSLSSDLSNLISTNHGGFSMEEADNDRASDSDGTRRADTTYNVDTYHTFGKATGSEETPYKGGKKMEKKQEGNQQQQMEKRAESGHEDKKVSLEGLPVEDSPYVNYGDLEDYKRKAYGTEGHLEPKTGRGAGATDAPTISGGAASSEASAKVTDTINRLGVP
ncbi:unnamed protein product [Dovyalis caffra]|uniref:Uncharacterized protein n=1 Tax=Dovyalis caffra TaxID=77055 RepID=A0AAV1RV49_9ROSI|nr:unnamed protein product [Dovyalis caffra]